MTLPPRTRIIEPDRQTSAIEMNLHSIAILVARAFEHIRFELANLDGYRPRPARRTGVGRAN